MWYSSDTKMQQNIVDLIALSDQLFLRFGGLYLLTCGMTKYRKGPTKYRQRTAKEHYGLSCRKLAPIELNGALYSSARQDFSHAAGLS